MLDIEFVSSVAFGCSSLGIKLKKTDNEEHSDTPAISDSDGQYVKFKQNNNL